MRYTVHVTIVVAVEVDAKNEKQAKDIAINNILVEGAVEEANQFDESAVIFETHPVKKVKRGIGSY